MTLYDDLRKNNVGLTIVTQNIDTTTIQGELLQTMLMAFAEFERKMNSERTKEKRLETIKAGLWPGGFQILGYDLDERKLVVNEEEAVIVRDIFDRYLQLKSAVKVARSMNKDGYRNKQWITKKGNTRGGGKFYKKILNKFVKQFENESINTKRELTKVLVKNVESHVNQNTNDGIIEVKYIADKRLEADWNEIKDKKNANFLSKVRTFGLSGSPGRITHMFLLPPLK